MNDRKQGPSLEDIDLREISAIIDRLEQSRFNYLDLRVGDLHITVGESAPSRPEGIASAAVSAGSSAATTASSPSLPPPAPGPAGSTSASSAGVASASPAAPADATPVRSPMVGRFYAQPEPGAAPFVRLGQRIEAGTTVGLVEVMKVFNAVTADVAGEVVALPVQDGEFVEFDQPIAWVRAG
ncbi:MAG: acetyl-CoA carboxylase biotin carboxyl carrier protein [Burkholderiaceae bacterium]|nr:acetyl-CoA carboxylase biotin carboxyl carrier protein [Burkholderiaceae bacterium]